MTNASRRHQLVANNSAGATVHRDLHGATFQLPNDSEQTLDLKPFLSPQITNVSDAASVTMDTTTTAAAAAAVAALDPPQRELLPAPPPNSGQSEDTNRGAALPRAKIISSIASFLSLCLYLAIRAGRVKCESNCD